MPHRNLTWIILAGGRSCRMGRPKETLPWGSGTLLDAAVAKAQAMDAAKILISGNAVHPLAVTCRDIIADSGPLGGICSCLQAMDSQYAMILPVDVPLLPEALAEPMAAMALEQKLDYLPLSWNGQLHPTVAIVSRRAAPAAQAMLRRGERRLRQLADRVPSGVYSAQGDELLLTNCNTPEDYAGLYCRAFGYPPEI